MIMQNMDNGGDGGTPSSYGYLKSQPFYYSNRPVHSELDGRSPSKAVQHRHRRKVLVLSTVLWYANAAMTGWHLLVLRLPTNAVLCEIIRQGSATTHLYTKRFFVCENSPNLCPTISWVIVTGK